ncbi:uncharacterized protein LOC132173910 [Corylus avellana]|uniref:uncharacterized protein LOC132173910 n=1 Tax=Corylus avellana TaxID=13451 RepID=UPI00286C8366|nr:uncharacterized protein LOC132173910 [Corylus avellana]
MQLQELNSCFNEANSELLLCVACLSPDDMFASFNKEKLLRLAQFYPNNFSAVQLITLDNLLETYIVDMHSSDEFATLKGIGQLAEKLVEMKKDVVYHLVYSLVTLSLILPVAIASVERAFSAMNIVKNRLRNRIGDQWMNDCLVTYIEKDIFKTISNEEIMKRFQALPVCHSVWVLILGFLSNSPLFYFVFTADLLRSLCHPPSAVGFFLEPSNEEPQRPLLR